MKTYTLLFSFAAISSCGARTVPTMVTVPGATQCTEQLPTPSQDACTAAEAEKLAEACRRKFGMACKAGGFGFDKPDVTGGVTRPAVTGDRTTGRPPATGSNDDCKADQLPTASTEACTAAEAEKLDKSCRLKFAMACKAGGFGFDKPEVTGTRPAVTGDRTRPAVTGSTGSNDECTQSDVTATDESCTTGIRELFTKNPRCVLKLKNACQERDTKAPTIPAACTKWFDGCNECAVDDDGKKAGCTRRFCVKAARAFCTSFKDGRMCKQGGEDSKVVCRKPNAPSTEPKKPTCEDITSDLSLAKQETCRKALYLCKDNRDMIQDCQAEKEEEEKVECKTVQDGPRKAKCCVEDKLSGDECKSFGESDKLPEDCKTRCFDDDGKFKADVRECVSCRGNDSLRPQRPDGKPDEKPEERAFDPARVKNTIENIADKLDNEDGKKCIQSIARATAKLKTVLRRWRKNKPNEKEEPEEETDNKELAAVAADIEETAESSRILEDEFEADAEGDAFRAKNDEDRPSPKEKIDDADKPKRPACQPDFETLKTRFNDLVDKYSGLPAKLKADGIKRVAIKFADMDLGRTDLMDSKSVCTFARKFVGLLKKAETAHKTRLEEARTLLCTRAGEVLKSKLFSKLSNCLRKAKRDAQAGSDADAKDDTDSDAKKFDNSIGKRAQKLVGLMKKKCLMKGTDPDSKPQLVSNVFRETLRARIKNKAGSELTQDDKDKIAKRINDAVKDKTPNAENIVTTLSNGRRRLRPRRALETSVVAETTWNTDSPSADDVDVASALGADFFVSDKTINSDSTDSSIEVTEPIQPIDSDLPSGDGGATTKKQGAGGETTKKDDGGAKASTGTMKIAFGTATALCTTLFAICF